MRQLQRDGRCASSASSTHATPDVISAAIRSDEYRPRPTCTGTSSTTSTAPCIARRPSATWASLHHQPERQGRAIVPSAAKLKLCTPPTMQFNDLYCLARPEVHTLSVGSRVSLHFDEHLAALAHYDTAAQKWLPLIDNAVLREEMERFSVADWCRRWFTGSPEYFDVPGQVNVLEIRASGPMRSRSNSPTGPGSATTCSARRLFGSPVNTPGNSNPTPAKRSCRNPSQTGFPRSFQETHQLFCTSP